jgi:hypothetical protein
MNHLASKILTYLGDVEQHVQTHSALSVDVEIDPSNTPAGPWMPKEVVDQPAT